MSTDSPLLDDEFEFEDFKSYVYYRSGIFRYELSRDEKQSQADYVLETEDMERFTVTTGEGTPVDDQRVRAQAIAQVKEALRWDLGGDFRRIFDILRASGQPVIYAHVIKAIVDWGEVKYAAHALNNLPEGYQDIGAQAFLTVIRQLYS